MELRERRERERERKERTPRERARAVSATKDERGSDTDETGRAGLHVRDEFGNC
jgi:hypothetical protein